MKHRLPAIIVFLLLCGASTLWSEADWRGTYTWSNGLQGEVLSLCSDGTFGMVSFSDTALPCCYYAGRYVETDTTFQLTLTDRVEQSPPAPCRGGGGNAVAITTAPDLFQFDSVLHKVAWGPRHYLIPRSQIPDFVSALNARLEPRYGALQQFLLLGDDGNFPVTDLPPIPSRYQTLVDTVTVVTGRVVAILSDSTAQIQFDGSAGVHPGFLYQGQNIVFKVTEVTGDVAVALAYPLEYPFRFPIHVGTGWTERERADRGFAVGTRITNRMRY